ncbi:hypothetical protein [Streptomyces niveus]|uniref:hypothetical protein n=1 Tax=Streptomyces niveus TaxID=193462 RepID=UPI00386E390C
MDLHAWITDRVDAHYALAKAAENDLWEVAQEGQGSAASTLRRYEADRRILARHTLNTDDCFESACLGCDVDSWGLPHTGNLNDCPELLDLAHAHGITDDVLAGLDRPQSPEMEPRATTARTLPEHVAHLVITATPPITTADVPEALRGPNWKP